MRLVELLTPQRVIVPLAADTLLGAAEELANALVESGAAANPEKIRELILDAIPDTVVSVGDAFLLHLRTDAVTKLAACLGIAAAPLTRAGSESDKAARILVVIVGPPKEASNYLQALSAFARLMGKEGVVKALLDARTPDEALVADALAEVELRGYLTVRDIMVPRSVAVRADTTLGEVSRLMVTHDVPALPVVSDSNELVGVVSHREVLRYLLPVYLKRMSRGAVEELARGGDVGDPHLLPVRQVMQRSVLSVSEDQTVAEVATIMVNKDIDRFPVVREGVLVGFLTRADVVRRIFGP